MNRKTFRDGFRYLSHRLNKIHPYDVQASITCRCNMKCDYCACPNLDIPEMSTQQWLDIIRGLHRLGAMRFKWQGGEPTLREDFALLTAEVKRLGITPALATNCTMIAERPELLDDLGEIIVSLNSLDEELQDGLRDKGSYRAIVKTMGLAVARGVKVVNNMVVTQANYDEMEALMEFCRARGVLFHAQPVMFGKESFDSTARHLELNRDQVVAMHRQLAQWKSQGEPVLFSASAYLNVQRWDDHRELYRLGERPSSCFAGHFYCHNEPNGDVYPCNMHLGVFEPKNIIKDGLVLALEHIQTHSCQDCWVTYFNERKAVFGLKWEAVKEVITRR